MNECKHPILSGPTKLKIKNKKIIKKNNNNIKTKKDNKPRYALLILSCEASTSQIV